MKLSSKYLFVIVFLMAVATACKKDENVIYYESGTAPVLTASRTGTLPLSFVTRKNVLLKLTWTNPEYKFTTGISSQDVTYMIEIDTTGANFTNPKRARISISKELERSFTDSVINDLLVNQLELDTLKDHLVEIRVTSYIGSAVPLHSNVFKYTAVRPYSIPPKVAPPLNGNLWATGDAFASGWTNPLLAPYVTTQKFTKLSTTLYEATVNMTGTPGGYKLLQDNGDWTTQYHMLAGGTWEGGDFEMKNLDPQFPGAPSPGTYKITVDFQKGKYSVIKL
jgi:hypothetical protein